MDKLKLLHAAKLYNIDVSGVRPFVFDLDPSCTGRVVEITETDSIGAAPFSKFSIEQLHPRQGLFSVDLKNGGPSLDMLLLICEELGPDNYRFDIIAYCNGLKRFNDVTRKSQPAMYHAATTIVREKLALLRSRHTGEISTVQSASIKTSTGKRVKCKPRSYIYVSAANKRSERPSDARSAKVRWHESTEVIAHWRRLNNAESLGLDRAGNRVVPGYTFIKEHLRGKDKDNPVIKIRKVG